MSYSPSIVYMGTPHFAVEPLRAILEKGYNVKAVVTAPDKPAGRGLKLTESPVKVFAKQHGLLVLHPEKLRDQVFLDQLRQIAPDIMVVVAFRMLPESVWGIAKLGTFNLHASLLPQYRGAAPINWAIMNGESQTGLTTFLIDHQIDTGHILFSKNVDILPDETAGQLHDKLMTMSGALVIQTIEALSRGMVKPLSQTELLSPAEQPKLAPKLSRETCRIDWSRPSHEVYNHIRGLSPYPGAWSQMALPDGSETTAKILEVSLPERKIASGPDAGLIVPCGIGTISIEQIQPAGKKPMLATEFLRGIRGEGKLKFI